MRYAFLLAVCLSAVAACSEVDDAVESRSADNAPSEAIRLPLAEAEPVAGHIWPDALRNVALDCPERVWSKTELLSDEEFGWSSDYWRAAGEKPLVDYLPDTQAGQLLALRFFWTPAFHEHVVARVSEGENREFRLTAKRFAMVEGRHAPDVSQDLERPLTSAERAELLEAIEQSRLFEQPSGNCDLGLDGSGWTIEAIESGNYRFIDRWSPDSGPVREVGETLLDFTGWEFEAIY